jgi:hypothetical protein
MTKRMKERELTGGVKSVGGSEHMEVVKFSSALVTHFTMEGECTFEINCEASGPGAREPIRSADEAKGQG